MINLLIILTLSIGNSARSQPGPIPQAVTQAFVSQYPHARVKKWEHIQNTYIAAFRQHGTKEMAYYSKEGEWQYTDSIIKWTRQLPKAVKKGWDNCPYITWKLMEIKKRETPSAVFYVIHVAEIQSLGPDDADIGREYDLQFDITGKLLNSTRLD